MAIAAVDQRQTAKGDGEGLNVQFRIMDGPYRNSVYFHWITVQHSNPSAQAMGLGDLSRLFVAIGIRGVKSSAELIGRELAIELAADKTDTSRMRVKKMTSLADYQKRNGTDPANAWGAL